MLLTHLRLLEVVDEMLDVAEATPETEEEIDDVDREVDKVELVVGMITADELELELEVLEVLEEMSVDVVLELETTDWDGAGIATEELGLLVETAALEAEALVADTAPFKATSHTSEAWKSDMCSILTKQSSDATKRTKGIVGDWEDAKEGKLVKRGQLEL